MACVLTHALVGVAGGRIATAKRMPARYWVALPVLAVLPDADSIGFSYGVPYGSFFGHRGFFHGIPFAVALGFAVAFLLFREKRLRIGLAFAVVAASHGILDAMTDGGLGIALFSPFDDARYFLPFRPLEVSPIGVAAFFSEWGVEVLVSEAKFVWLPLCFLLRAVERIRGGRILFIG